MSENQNQSGSQPAKIASAGKPERAELSSIHGNQSSDAFTQNNDSQGSQEGGEGDQGQGQQQGGGSLDQSQNGQQGTQPTPLTDEQIKAALKERGVEFEGTFDDLKNKITPKQEPSPQETEDQKKQREAAIEKRMLDYYIEQGGSAENYVQLKQLAAADLTELSEAQLKAEMKAAGFNDEETALILKERYYQITDEELEQYADETEKEFLKRKKEFGTKKLQSRSLIQQQKAQELLKQLGDAVIAQDSFAKKEQEFQSKVDEHLTTLPRKITFELGKSNDEEIDPIVYEVEDSVISEIAATLKDPSKRKTLFYNEDNSVNLQAVSDLLLKNKILESALKKVYLEGGTRQVKKLEQVFPNNPHGVGVGGQQGNTGKKGKLVSAGKPQVVVR